jgi:hypothetical protein
VNETTLFWAKRTVSFKWKQRQTYVKVQISPQFVICSIESSIAILILKINSIASLLNSIVSLEVGRFFQIDPWSQICAIWPSIE